VLVTLYILDISSYFFFLYIYIVFVKYVNLRPEIVKFVSKSGYTS